MCMRVRDPDPAVLQPGKPKCLHGIQQSADRYEIMLYIDPCNRDPET
jgi:hypothetical protein